MALISGIFVVVVCSWHGGAVSAPASSPRAVGQQVGELVRDADQRQAKGGESSTFHASIVGAIEADEEGLVNPDVSRVVADANGVAARTIVAADGVCTRKWSHPCPDGWSVQSTTCLAPPAYGGPCKAAQSFASSNVLEKHNFAISCKAPWPCQDDCGEGHDYDTCPKGWMESGGGFCKSSSAAPSQCSQEYKFDEMGIDEKQEIGLACGFEWRCKSICARDYSVRCPETWTELEEICVAPSTYAGDCKYSVNVAEMTEDQKRAFAGKCAVEFPCRGSDTAAKPLGSERARSPSGVSNGPLGSGGSANAGSGGGRREAYSGRFASRFVTPSGPVDAVGDVHF